MNYSICYLDKLGRTERSRLETFEGDAQAMIFARSQIHQHAIIEVWKDDHLVERLFLEPPIVQ